MKLVESPLSKEELKEIRNQYGNYIKVTVDIEKEIVVLGCELHADGEKILLEKGSSQVDIWGGGIDLESKIIDATAVLNLRPRFENTSIEILDKKRREAFLKIVKRYFNEL